MEVRNSREMFRAVLLMLSNQLSLRIKIMKAPIIINTLTEDGVLHLVRDPKENRSKEWKRNMNSIPDFSTLKYLYLHFTLVHGTWSLFREKHGSGIMIGSHNSDDWNGEGLGESPGGWKGQNNLCRDPEESNTVGIRMKQEAGRGTGDCLWVRAVCKAGGQEN